jgi:hypothetical protein
MFITHSIYFSLNFLGDWVISFKTGVFGVILKPKICITQGRSNHVNHVSRDSQDDTLKNEKTIKPSVLFSWFSGTPYTGVQQNRSNEIHR